MSNQPLKHTREALPDQRGEMYRLYAGDTPLMYADAITCWQQDATFRDYQTRLIKDSQYDAVRWETPAITRATAAELPYAFVLLDCPGLDRPTDRVAFAEYFDASPEESVLSFTNLRGDATMVVPRPLHDTTDYTHIAGFLRSATDDQAHALWQAVGRAVEAAFGEQPLWVSTAGMGVAWLHVRLDTRPKYYGYAPYRNAD